MDEQGKQQRSAHRSGMRDPANLMILIYSALILCGLLFGGVRSVSAQTVDMETSTLAINEVQRGELLIVDDRGSGYIPTTLLSSDVQISISGITARTTVRQKFHNLSNRWVEGIYVFPLPDESGVDHMQMMVGERKIVGVIKEKEEARAIYKAAKEQGKKTSLLAQKRPNIFTTAIANIGPQETVIVEIEYQQQVNLSGDIFSLRYPMVVAPRYIPGKPVRQERLKSLRFDGGGWAVDTDQVPDAAEITPPVAASHEAAVHPVTLSVELAAGVPVQLITSLYHGIKTEETSPGIYHIEFTGAVFADRDFVLEWKNTPESRVRAALFSEAKGQETYSLLMLVPPAGVTRASSLPREVIFVLDTSGSMAGESIRQAKNALHLAISRLGADDSFNIIEFNNRASRLYPSPRPLTATSRAVAHRFVDSLVADGGTEMSAALQMALDGRQRHARLRQVIFLTDGSVGNEEELFGIIHQRLGDSRLFTVGIGSAPNTYFMSRAAALGRGTFTFIGKRDEVDEKMSALFTKLEQSVVTDLRISAAGQEGGALVVFPSPLPDLYAEEPLFASLKTRGLAETLIVSGRIDGQPWSVDVSTQDHPRRPGIATLWARKKIRSEMQSLALGADREDVKKTVTATALAHHLVSRYTSLVAVEEKVSRPAAQELLPEQLRTNLPTGMQQAPIFGGAAKTATASDLSILLGITLLALAALGGKLRGRWLIWK